MTIPSKQIEVDKWIPLCQEKFFGSETPTNALTGLTTKGIYHSIGYGIRFFFLKLHPFWISNEDLREWKIQTKNKKQTNTSQLLESCNINLNFPALTLFNWQKRAGISKYFFSFSVPTLRYIITLGFYNTSVTSDFCPCYCLDCWDLHYNP